MLPMLEIAPAQIFPAVFLGMPLKQLANLSASRPTLEYARKKHAFTHF